MHKSQRLADSPRRKEGPEKRTIPKKIPHFDHVFGEWEKRVDEGTVIRLAPEQWDAILFNGCSVFTDKEEELRPQVRVGNKTLNHRHIFPRDQSVEVRFETSCSLKIASKCWLIDTSKWSNTRTMISGIGNHRRQRTKNDS
ncbi:hypothetical protein F2Q68_00038940 [Brassica cretica]|uniref:Uncharacterized protein n=2 Tax=Brassica cretica TaxID=69181 RepID=A0ABQ7A8D3_BRACR|nr:hypothetical protein F2Q68_00038940 [Brassica cretica]KAF3493948.1 hypothetical protein DY000_02052506 [Brassica cretica]